jgi:hypothetical protein
MKTAIITILYAACIATCAFMDAAQAQSQTRCTNYSTGQIIYVRFSCPPGWTPG